MAQIASLLAVATSCFHWLMDSFYSQGGGGGLAYTRDKTTYTGT